MFPSLRVSGECERRRSVMTQSAKAQDKTNPATVNLPDSWDTRVQNASVFLGIDPTQVEEKLKELGVQKDEYGLQYLSDEEVTPFGDLRRIFGDEMGIPIAKLRMAMKSLRGPKDSDKTDTIDPESVRLQHKYGIKMRLSNVDSVKLIEDYNPDKPTHPITIELKKRFEDKHVIAFKPDSKVVDVEATANYIADVEQGYVEEETIEVDGILVRLYCIGEIPNQLIDEDPLFPGKPLKRGRSVVNRINWSNIDEDTRRLCRIIVEEGSIDEDSRSEVRELAKLASEGLKAVGEVYPEAYLEYRERKEKDDLPKLRLTLQEANGNGKSNNPFGVSNRQY